MSQRKKQKSSIRTEPSHILNEEEPKELIPERLYRDRDSLLTEMFKINHFNSLLNMFFSFIVLMLINTILNDWLELGLFEHTHHFVWVSEAFAQPALVFIVIMIMYFLSVSTFLLAKLWVMLKIKWKNIGIAIDIVSAIAYVTIYGTIVALPIWVAMNYDIPPCSSAFVVYEQIRLCMKIHAFMRSVIPRLSSCFKNQPDEICSILSWDKFAYFFIIPTLIYRDSYPKRKFVNYHFATSCFTQFIMCVIFMYYIFIHLLRPIFFDFQPSFMTKEILIPKLFQTILPTILMMLTLFFGFLHLWMNTFAELTRFGDRQFYKDWWNATSLSDYLRTWNVLIHDWLYTYLYKDISNAIFMLTNHRKVSKSFGMVIVLLFSSLVHEYILAFCFHFFYPVLLTVYFGSGTILYFVKSSRTSRASNVMLWTSLFIGNTIFVTFYSLEWYARRNCKSQVQGYWDFISPRTFSCQTIK